MRTQIYYFSGTGNSLAVARDIAKKTNADLIPIPSVIDREAISLSSDTAGIVFPMYHHSIPYIIQRFVDKIQNLEDKYIFGVCTYGGSPGICMEHLGRAVESNGGYLSCGFAVKMPYNYIFPAFTVKGFFNSFTLRESSFEEQSRLFDDCKKKLMVICDYIRNRRKGKIETSAAAIEHLVESLNLRDTLQKSVWMKVADADNVPGLTFSESIRFMDNGFNVDPRCTGCGVCAKICPVDNIIADQDKPKWLHHCEQCFACLHWCPNQAIQFGKGTVGKRRYHHPTVNMSDLIPEKKKI